MNEIEMLLRQAMHAYRRHHLGTADSLGQKVLEQQPKNVNALALVAQVALESGRYDRAAELLTKAIKTQPKHAALRVQLGLVFAAQMQFSRALAQYEKALKVQPGLEDALVAKAAVFESQNKYDKIRRMLKPVVSGRTPSPEAASVYLRALIHDGDIGEAIALGERVVASSHAPTPGLRDAWFALARAHERNEDYERSFAAARQANDLAAPIFDRDEHRRTIDEIIEVFTRERIAALPRPAEPSETPIFIVGMLRSGSTLTERIIASHPSACGVGETSAMHLLINDLPSMIGTRERYPRFATQLTPAVVESAAETYLDALAKLVPRNPRPVRIANKDLSNYRNLGLINVLFPRARVIHCRRQALDVCLSCYMERLTPVQAPYATDLTNLGCYYREYERLMDHWREVLDAPFLEIDYEDLVTNQEAVTRRLIDFCGLEWNDACLRFHETKRYDHTLSQDQVRRPLYRSSVNRADRYGPLLDPLRKALG